MPSCRSRIPFFHRSRSNRRFLRYSCRYVVIGCGKHSFIECVPNLIQVVFIMLYGYNPFNPRAKSAIKYRSNICKRILKGFSNETRPGYGAYFPKCIHVSENAMDFVAHLLVVDSDARFTCEQALEHPWLKQSLMNN